MISFGGDKGKRRKQPKRFRNSGTGKFTCIVKR